LLPTLAPERRKLQIFGRAKRAKKRVTLGDQRPVGAEARTFAVLLGHVGGNVTA
jgi:hypothetical protein